MTEKEALKFIEDNALEIIYGLGDSKEIHVGRTINGVEFYGTAEDSIVEATEDFILTVRKIREGFLNSSGELIDMVELGKLINSVQWVNLFYIKKQTIIKRKV